MADARMEALPGEESVQAAISTRAWAEGTHVRAFATKELRPVEVLLMLHHRDALRGRVLEIGCGAGRLTGYLIDISHDTLGIDVSPAMIEHCRARYPRGRFEVGDLRDLSAHADGSYDVIVAGFNVIDVLDHEERLHALGEFSRILAPAGLLVFSSHNRDAGIPGALALRMNDPLRFAADVVRMPRRVRNHRRVRRFEQETAAYAIRNDGALDFTLLHYYVDRNACERQLAERGFELVECRDLEGEPVTGGTGASWCSELHYVARSAP